jgi:hypothetical protein
LAPGLSQGEVEEVALVGGQVPAGGPFHSGVGVWLAWPVREGVHEANETKAEWMSSSVALTTPASASAGVGRVRFPNRRRR